jgi:hypothetical protein
MSVWSTRAFEKARNYIVIQHTLRGVNYVVNGIRFRDSYAVVEKNSKTYNNLKRIPVLRAAKEYPLTYLAKLSFITRHQDIKMVYGQDVYVSFLREFEKEHAEQTALVELQKLEEADKALAKREEELRLKAELSQKAQAAIETGDVAAAEAIKAQMPEIVKCSHRNDKGELCGKDAYEFSPSGYCGTHLLEDPRLPEFGLEKPGFMTKDETKAFREKSKEVLKKAKKQNKF